MEVYEIVYDYCGEDGNEERNLYDTVEVSGWGELKEMLKLWRLRGCYNINATYLYDRDEVLYGG